MGIGVPSSEHPFFPALLIPLEASYRLWAVSRSKHSWLSSGIGSRFLCWLWKPCYSSGGAQPVGEQGANYSAGEPLGRRWRGPARSHGNDYWKQRLPLCKRLSGGTELKGVRLYPRGAGCNLRCWLVLLSAFSACVGFLRFRALWLGMKGVHPVQRDSCPAAVLLDRNYNSIKQKEGWAGVVYHYICS